jgi:hypothetical protein
MTDRHSILVLEVCSFLLSLWAIWARHEVKRLRSEVETLRAELHEAVTILLSVGRKPEAANGGE